MRVFLKVTTPVTKQGLGVPLFFLVVTVDERL